LLQYLTPYIPPQGSGRSKVFMQQSHAVAGYLAGLAAITCWAGFVLVARIGGQGTLEAADTVALRFLVGCTLLLPLAYFHRPWINWRGLALAASGGLGYCLFVYAGFRHTTAIHAAVLLPGLIPFLSALFAVWLLHERLSALRGLGLGLIAVGGILMLNDVSQAASLRGDLYLAMAVVCWALYTVLAKRWKISVWQATTTVAYGSLLMFMPIYAVFFNSKLSAAPWPELFLQGFYQGFIAVIVAMVFYMIAVERIGPARMGAMMALVPCISGFAAVPLLKETLSNQGLIALVITSLGAVLATGIMQSLRKPSRQKTAIDIP
jgi:drug/metabolite transporter (DMT)-like permease